MSTRETSVSDQGVQLSSKDSITPLLKTKAFIAAGVVAIAPFAGISSSHAYEAESPVVVIDPGHSGLDIQSIDSKTGLIDHDYPNHPEMEEVFAVSKTVQKELQKDGYTVIMTKKSVDDTVSLRERAEIANRNHADLAVSIHDDNGQPWETFAQVYVQEVGLHRDTPDGTQITFTDTETAKKSKKYGIIFARERAKEEKHQVIIKRNSFNGRAGISPGNIPMVQLFSKVPWIYNEVGVSGKLTKKQMNQYAQGIVASVEASVPIPEK